MKKAIIILAVFLVLVAGGSGAGYYIIHGQLEDTRSQLQEASQTAAMQQASIEAYKAEIEGYQAAANELKSQIETLDQDLKSTNVKLEAKSYLLDQARTSKQDLSMELASYKEGYTNTKAQLSMISEDLVEAQGKIGLMRDLFGDVSSGEIPKGIITDGDEDGNRVFNLVRNPKAVDPSWDELMEFLENDYTDTKLYVDGIYTCGNFAEDVFNNAEAAGIRAAVVCVKFEDERVGHALNAFKTTDSGLVFIDCTGDIENTAKIRMTSIVDLEIGCYYDRDFLFSEEGYLLTDHIVKSLSIYW